MNINKPVMAAALMALGMAATSGTLFAADMAADGAKAADAKVEMEHCGGLVKAGMNDSGANGHACAGQAKADSDPKEFIALPKGTCEKFAGGIVLSEDKKAM